MQDRESRPLAAALPRIVQPIQEFLYTESAGGVLLLIAAISALIWVNSPVGDSYFDFWNAHLTIDLHIIELDESLLHWVNDGLMAIFFFVVGLEIKHELLQGELTGRRKAALPVAAALGGMIVPAAVYIAFNAGNGESARGWGIPMATDIAFAIGVLSLLGRRVPISLKVFLLALAIVDDLGAILVIAIFYTDDLAFGWMLGAIGAFAAIIVMGRIGIRDVIAYAVVGTFAWLAVFESGIHATVAGVVLGLLTPINPYFEQQHFAQRAPQLLRRFHEGDDQPAIQGVETRQTALRELEELARESQSVLNRLEHSLHPWTSYVIVPIFALANAGVDLGGDAIRDAATSSVSLGVALGLAIGKPTGILLFSWIAVRGGLAELPRGVGWTRVAGVGMIAGIGFTVSLFITGLAFTDAALIDESKIGILFGSAAMGIAGFATLRFMTRTPAPAPVERSEEQQVRPTGAALE